MRRVDFLRTLHCKVRTLSIAACKRFPSESKRRLIHRSLISCVISLIALLGVSASLAASEPRTQNEIEFQLLSAVIPGSSVELVNGDIVSPSDWQTIILARFYRPGSTKASSCTATFVGPNVILMAAHCVDAPYSIPSIRPSSLAIDGGQIALHCEIHPDYLNHLPKFMSPRGSEDYAFCLLGDGINLPSSISTFRSEVIDEDTKLAKGEAVLMTGYGCSAMTVKDGQITPDGFDSALRIGKAVIDTGANQVENSSYVTVRSVVGKGVALCPGDSGGPLFTGVRISDPDAPRRIRGVNSAVQAVSSGSTTDLISSLSATSTAKFRTWAMDWIQRRKDNRPVICGINAQPGEFPCRD